jgi:4-amino-4-deoxy-L-arabinose transferase-like glycosyltransferase
MTGRHRLALAGLLVGLAAVMVVWLGIDRRPPEWDHANHLERAVACHRSLGESGGDWLQEIIRESSFYPPIVTCAAGLLYFALPIVPLTAQAVIWAFLVLGTLAIFGLGRRLLDADAGLLAAFLFATAPFVVFMLFNFQLDLPLAAMVALALYMLVRTEDLALRRWALGLGLVLGLGLLTKPPFAAYLSGPLLWVAWRGLRAPDRRARLLHLLAAGGGGGGRAPVVRPAPGRLAGPVHQPLVQAGGGGGAGPGVQRLLAAVLSRVDHRPVDSWRPRSCCGGSWRSRAGPGPAGSCGPR